MSASQRTLVIFYKRRRFFWQSNPCLVIKYDVIFRSIIPAGKKLQFFFLLNKEEMLVSFLFNSDKGDHSGFGADYWKIVIKVRFWGKGLCDWIGSSLLSSSASNKHCKHIKHKIKWSASNKHNKRNRHNNHKNKTAHKPQRLLQKVDAGVQ